MDDIFTYILYGYNVVYTEKYWGMREPGFTEAIIIID